MISINPSLLSGLAPQAGCRKNNQTAIVDIAARVMQAQFPVAGLTTTLRIAHFLAQVCQEADGFCTTEEYASGEAYEGRLDLGNTEPGDGVRFKGRGLIMITGRANYSTYGQKLDLPLVQEPALAADPAHAVTIAIAFWTAHGLNAMADKDDIRSITERINGGLNGLLTRQLYLSRAKRLILPPVAPAAIA